MTKLLNITYLLLSLYSTCAFSASQSGTLGVGMGVITPEVKGGTYNYFDIIMNRPSPIENVGFFAGLSLSHSEIDSSNLSSEALWLGYLFGVNYIASDRLTFGVGSYIMNTIEVKVNDAIIDDGTEFSFDSFVLTSNYLVSEHFGVGYKIHLPKNGGDSIHSLLFLWR